MGDEMSEIYQKVIELFKTESQKIPDVYDLLLRGSASGCNTKKTFVKNWSDLVLLWKKSHQKL